MRSDVRKSSRNDPESLVESAAALLLRSPRLSVSRVLELLDIGDAEFRRMCDDNPRLAAALRARQQGEFDDGRADLTACAGCGDWFVPYGGARCCSDECRTIHRLQQHQRLPRSGGQRLRRD